MTNSTRMLSALCLLVAVSGCQGDDMLGTRFVTSADVEAAAGGTLAVTTDDSAELAGTTLVIPAGALAADTHITISTQNASLVDAPASSAGPVVVFGPAGTQFSTPVTLTIPYDPGTSAGAVFVQVVEENGERFSLVPVAMDTELLLATVQIRGFTGFEPAVPGGTEVCQNGVDDDGNGLIDCDDPACAGTPICGGGSVEICDNGIDDDLDGLVDCADADCQTGGGVCGGGTEQCDNGIDDDGDGDVDCDDVDCQNPAGGGFCNGAPENCQLPGDEDGDGLSDCDDPDCQALGGCISSEIDCGNGIDDDGDGFVDCADSDCQIPGGGCSP